KFSHTLFSLPFVFVGFFMATQQSDATLSLRLLLLVVLSVVFARNAAMSFNRYVDRFMDASNERTRIRELPRGVIMPRSALIFSVLNSILFITTTWFINPLCFYLSPVALMVILGYSYSKRFTFICHLILGLGLALAPIGAYIAVTAYFSVAPILLSFAVLFWVAGFDIIYSLQDEYFDKANRLHSVPAKFGRKRALTISSVLHILTVVLLFLTGRWLDTHWLYYVGACLFSLLLGYQHLIISVKDISKVNLAFFVTNGVAAIVYAVVVIVSFFV
ncbi:MAG: UbiA-like polyprenyltransferase, partial [Bacteroidales bacterium]|nr:UbiA-like polyprenyltransferase [Bacteroidales bacterium]